MSPTSVDIGYDHKMNVVIFNKNWFYLKSIIVSRN